MNKNFICLHQNDDVLIALENLEIGVEIRDNEQIIKINNPIPAGHKFARHNIADGAEVRRYNQIIGKAKNHINCGEHIHSHNLGIDNCMQNNYYDFINNSPTVKNSPAPRYFMGFKRANGKVGTRNYLAVISTVNCSSTVTRAIANHFSHNLQEKYPNVEGVIPLPHPMGCGTGASGEAIEILKRTIIGYANHPNFAGVLLVGLGCEQNQVQPLLKKINTLEKGMIEYIVIQEEGGTAPSIKKGIEKIQKMLERANNYHRQKLPIANLIVGLKCGGSDGYSGITANPALGGVADLIVDQGGTVVLAETPEIYGAEHLLIKRAKSRDVADKLISRINWWKDYTAKAGCEMDNNPSVGNKAGGITTILEKSLGAVAKAGTSTLNQIYNYAEEICESGLVYMDTPGYDPVSVTGMAAGGAQIICFTTGRGSALGCAGVPTIKLATNNELFKNMADDMDINCGDLVDGITLSEISERIFEGLISYASGEKVKSEVHGYGNEEFMPWKIDATM